MVSFGKHKGKTLPQILLHDPLQRSVLFRVKLEGGREHDVVPVVKDAVVVGEVEILGGIGLVDVRVAIRERPQHIVIRQLFQDTQRLGVQLHPLPLAQVDRFMLKLLVDYPSREEERAILERMTVGAIPEVQAVVGVDEILRAREAVSTIYVDDKIKEYGLA